MLYRGVVTGVRTVSSSRVAELAKPYENVFRNVNIALANELAIVLTDHSDFDYAEAVERAPLVVDARNATWGLAAPEGRVVRL